MEENNTYELSVYCKNCDFNGKVKIPKGIKVEEHSCPNCEVVELERDFNAENQIQSY